MEPNGTYYWTFTVCIFSFVQDIEKAFSTNVLGQFAGGTIIICATAFELTTVSKTKTLGYSHMHTPNKIDVKS